MSRADEGDIAPAPSRAPYALFSLETVAAEKRFEVWKESISCIFDVERDKTAPRGDFDARLEACLLGEAMLARTSGSGQRWRRSEATIARDGMDHFMVQLFLGGGMEAAHRGGHSDVGGGALVVFDLAREVASRTGDFTNLSLIVPREGVEAALLRPDDQHMRVLRAGEPMADLLIRHMLALHGVMASIPAAHARELGLATSALAVACLNGAETDAPLAGEGAAVARLITVKRIIERNLADPDLSASRIARMAGISRSTLYALFEPLGGVSRFVRERRLRKARAMLADPRQRYRPIYEIAAASGFVNESAFSRVFRQRFECTPGQARRGEEERPARSGGGAPDGRRYEHWLHHLAN